MERVRRASLAVLDLSESNRVGYGDCPVRGRASLWATSTFIFPFTHSLPIPLVTVEITLCITRVVVCINRVVIYP